MSPLHPTKYGRTFFIKKLCMGKQSILETFFFFWGGGGGGGGGGYMGTNDQIMQGGKLMVKRFQMSSPVSSSSD